MPARGYGMMAWLTPPTPGVFSHLRFRRRSTHP